MITTPKKCVAKVNFNKMCLLTKLCLTYVVVLFLKTAVL